MSEGPAVTSRRQSQKKGLAGERGLGATDLRHDVGQCVNTLADCPVKEELVGTVVGDESGMEAAASRTGASSGRTGLRQTAGTFAICFRNTFTLMVPGCRVAK